jgi:two-component system LytT family response regulator
MNPLIVGDERMARQELKRLLLAHPDIEVVGEANTGEQALGLIPRLAPDVIFLDVQMPGMTGFELLERLDDVPQVIFTTAYDKYALKAFEVSALDYLVKPVAPARLAGALTRVRPRQERIRPERVFVKEGDRCWFVRMTDIFLLESEGNYTRLHFANERPLVCRSLATIEERLDPAVFFRAGRKCILNLKWVESVETGVSGNLIVGMRAGISVEVSRRQSAKFREALSL